MSYKTTVETYTEEIVIKKSRFIACLYSINGESDVKKIVGGLRKAHHQANHFCTAFRLHTSPIVERYSDDGEPSGTAGMPMLEVLRGQGLENVLLVSIRYFGGTKLGTGGLVRAYTQSAQEVIGRAAPIEVGSFCKMSVEVAYTLSGKIIYYVEQHQYLLDDVVYGEQVIYDLYIGIEKIHDVEKEMIELTNGMCQMTIHDPVDGYISNGRMVTEEVTHDYE